MKRFFPNRKAHRIDSFQSAESLLLTQQSIYILPSKYGVICLFVLLGMLLGAVNYANNLAYALTFILGSTGLVSIFHTYRNLAGLCLFAPVAEPVFAGDTLCFELLLQETSGRFRPNLWFRRDTTTSLIPLVPPLQTATGHLLVPTSQRGTVCLGRFSLLTLYPLGLFRAWSRFNSQASALVYPRPAENPPEMFEKQGAQGAAADASGARPGQEDFQGLKAYENGESYKRIDWKSYAREQGLLSKRFASGSNQPLWFDWQSLPAGDVETRLSLVCALVLKARRAQRVFGLRLPGQTILPSSGEEHTHHCLTALALFQAP